MRVGLHRAVSGTRFANQVSATSNRLTSVQRVDSTGALASDVASFGLGHVLTVERPKTERYNRRLRAEIHMEWA